MPIFRYIGPKRVENRQINVRKKIQKTTRKQWTEYSMYVPVIQVVM